MAKAKEVFDCTTCGACCVCSWGQRTFCDVTAADEKRLGPALVRRNVLRPDAFALFDGACMGREEPDGVLKTHVLESRAGAFKGMPLTACIFLCGSVFHNVACRVYENRPRVCRTAVKPGDKACKALRKRLLQEIGQ
jgi:Fe-S-cluster containining protein